MVIECPFYIIHKGLEPICMTEAALHCVPGAEYCCAIPPEQLDAKKKNKAWKQKMIKTIGG